MPEGERPTEEEIREAQAKRKKYQDLSRKRGAKVEEVEESLRELRDEREDKHGARRTLEKRHPDWTEEQLERRRDDIADQIEEIEADIDKLVERIDEDDDGDLEDKLAHAEHLREFYAERVERLRKKRKALAAKEGQLGKYWFRVEFNCREGDGCPEYMDPHLEQLCGVFLDKMREKFGPGRVNSGHRWRFYNIKIGGALFSFHEYEQRKEDPAGDCVFERGTPAEWAAYARQLANALGFGGVGQYATFVHVDTGPRRDWWG